MKKIILRILLCSLIAVIYVGLVSCNTNHTEVESKSLKNPSEENIQSPPDSEYVEDCEIIEKDGMNYIVFDDITKYTDSSQDQQLASVEFASVEEFINTLTEKNFTDMQKQIIATAFPKNEYGILSCDPQNIYEPQMPSGFVVDCVYWEGAS